MAAALPISEATFSLTVKNFSKLNEPVLSLPYYINNLPWKIMIMPRSNNVDRALGFFVQCNAGSKSKTWSCDAAAELRVKSYKSSNDPFVRKIRHKFCAEEDDWGFSYYMSWSEITDPKNGFIQNDIVRFEVYIVADPFQDEIV